MSADQPNNPLHGITLKVIVEDLASRRGWDDLGAKIDIRCFTNNPSIKSSLAFLRKNEWARAKVEKLYMQDQRQIERNRTRNRRRAEQRAHRAEGEATEVPNSDYLDRLMRRDSFEALWPLFANATKPAKEMTESFSALQHLRPLLPQEGPCRVIHVGDGAHARTAALFALKTEAENISVDPSLNLPLVEAWRERFGVRRLTWQKATIEEVSDQLDALDRMPVFVTFVHAHVRVDDVLDRLRWDAAFTLACCVPGNQLSQARVPFQEGEDPSVLSPDRHFQVLVNT